MIRHLTKIGMVALALAACEQSLMPKTAEEPAAPAPADEQRLTCVGSFWDRHRGVYRDGSLHGAIVGDKLHLGGQVYGAECDRPEDRQESIIGNYSTTRPTYHTLLVKYTDRAPFLYVARVSGTTTCLVKPGSLDTAVCLATLGVLGDGFDLSDLPATVPAVIGDPPSTEEPTPPPIVMGTFTPLPRPPAAKKPTPTESTPMRIHFDTPPPLAYRCNSFRFFPFRQHDLYVANWPPTEIAYRPITKGFNDELRNGRGYYRGMRWTHDGDDDTLTLTLSARPAVYSSMQHLGIVSFTMVFDWDGGGKRSGTATIEIVWDDDCNTYHRHRDRFNLGREYYAFHHSGIGHGSDDVIDVPDNNFRNEHIHGPLPENELARVRHTTKFVWCDGTYYYLIDGDCETQQRYEYEDAALDWEKIVRNCMNDAAEYIARDRAAPGSGPFWADIVRDDLERGGHATVVAMCEAEADRHPYHDRPAVYW